MKIYNKTLKKAHRYLKAGHYSRVISLLEPKVPLFIENYHFYYFLGTSCFYSGDMGGAETYLKRAIQVNRKAVDPRLFLAAVYLKKKDTTEAVRIWLGLLELDPTEKKAKKGLNKIRKISDPDDLSIFLDSGRFASMLPRTRKAVPTGVSALILISLILSALYLTAPRWLNSLGDIRKTGRENLTALYKSIDPEEIKNSESADALFILDEKEIRLTLKKAQDLFDQYRDNESRREINRLKYSNASEQVKQKALLLEGYLKNPDITTISGSFTYAEIYQNPRLYENCYILWKGRFSNLNYNDDLIQFDFLVGYEKSQVLEGIVPVQVSFPVKLDTAYPLELLGRIEIINEKAIRLQAVAVHNIIE